MWDKILKVTLPGRSTEAPSTAVSSGFHVYRVKLPEGLKDVVSLVPQEAAFESGFASEAIVGVCTQLLEKGDRITVANFRPNKQFVELLHGIIAAQGPQLPALQAEARRQVAGWVYIIDGRTPTPGGEVPPHDIIGVFAVKDGAIVPNSYQPNPNHRILSTDGLFQLEPTLRARLMERVTRPAATG
jgi:hypothetical protein